MKDNLTDFFLLQDPNVRWVVIAVVLMSISASITGCFTFLRKRALVGDAIAHAILPGVCLAFMFTQIKNPFILLIGATISGWLGLLSIDFITARTRLKPDTALSLVLSVFYGFGIFLLTIIQSSGNAAQSGLNNFLFGNAAAMVREDVITFTVFSGILILTVLALFNPFKLVIFDRDFAGVSGYPVEKIELLLSFLTVLAIAIGIQAVGVVLMSALLITPAASARYWTERLRQMMLLAAVFAAISGVSGAYVSYALPHMPTGPWIVMFLTFFALISILFGNKKGVIAAKIQQSRNNQKILLENILKCLYHLGEKEQKFNKAYTINEIQSKRLMPASDLKKGIKKLQNRNQITVSPANLIQLTLEGVKEGKRVTRVHRLWEIYLTKYMQLPVDHVHNDAEAIEHIITPELEKQLEDLLGKPLIDPHQSPIPY